MAKKGYRDAAVSAHISNTVASQIALLRERAGWTQTELAQKSGMKQSRISALEDPNYENFEVATLRRIASAFDVALSVRFVPFSEMLRWSTNVSPASLEVPKFEDDELDGREAGTSPSRSIVGVVLPQQMPRLPGLPFTELTEPEQLAKIQPGTFNDNEYRVIQ